MSNTPAEITREADVQWRLTEAQFEAACVGVRYPDLPFTLKPTALGDRTIMVHDARPYNARRDAMQFSSHLAMWRGLGSPAAIGKIQPNGAIAP